MSSSLIYVSQKLYDLTPLTYNENSNKYNKNFMMFINFPYLRSNNKVIRKIIYNDGTSKNINKNDIHYLRY